MKSPRIEVVCVGTELLTGKVNTHVGFLGEHLPGIGLTIAREHTVGDDPKLMEETFRELWRRSDVVICAGGLGPTFDDITRDVWSRVVKRKLKIDQRLVANIREKFRRRRIAMPPMNRRQAYVLKGAEAIQNPFGTAPGQWLAVGRKHLFLLPGPTREFAPMVQNFLLPHLERTYRLRPLVQRALLLVGVPESTVDHIIRPIIARHPQVAGNRVIYGILASRSIITVKFSVEETEARKVTDVADRLEEKLRAPLKQWIFGSGKETVEGVVGDLLRKKNKTVSVAESCTGGLVSKLLTDRAGASDYFVEGVVTYANRSKMMRLGVRKSSLEKFGAVSKAVAREMAIGIKRRSGSDYAVSVTGIAGPSGGTNEKPVGLVYIGCAGPRRNFVRQFNFDGAREWIRQRASLVALDILRRELLA